VTISLADATYRLSTDHELLLAQVTGRTEEELRARYLVAGGPLGDFCDSLHDLVAHVLMWDEINLAVLAEAAAGRLLPAALLLDRFRGVLGALMDEFSHCTEQAWAGSGPAPGASDGVGALAQHVWKVPGQPAFWHAAIHLEQLPAPGSATAEGTERQ